MASPTILIACPECQSQIKAPAELRGKKIRCKSCQHVFAVGSTGKAAPTKAAAKPEPTPAPPAEDPNALTYGVTTPELTPRCPHCAKEMESEEAVICLHCGYNTMTRTRPETKKAYERTGEDYFWWLLPGFLCLIGILIAAGIDAYAIMNMKAFVKYLEIEEYIKPGAFSTWLTIFLLVPCVPAAKFAFKRLILNPHPPEQEYD